MNEPLRPFVAVLFALLGACGSDPCAHPDAPCGGDLVGTWQAENACYTSTCSGVEVSQQPENRSTFTFRADGMATATLSLHGHVVWKMPLSCATGLATKCADLASQETTCTGDSVCACDTTLNEDSSLGAPRPYTTSGSTFTVDGSTTSYCVRGDRLTLSASSSTLTSVATYARVAP